jgi:hypothetical protein
VFALHAAPYRADAAVLAAGVIPECFA